MPRKPIHPLGQDEFKNFADDEALGPEMVKRCKKKESGWLRVSEL